MNKAKILYDIVRKTVKLRGYYDPWYCLNQKEREDWKLIVERFLHEQNGPQPKKAPPADP